jgi:pimeloyl-ACP methyl ester carboxylesterase
MTNARSYLQNVAKGAARPGKIAIVSFSMGGATAWNFTRSLGTGVVAGIIGIDSCTDLSWDRGTDQNHWKGATAASGGTVSVVKSTGGFASYMVGWTIPRPTGNVTITAFTSSTQVSVSPPLPTPITAGEILNLIPPDGAGLFYQNINQAYGGNGAEPDGVMNDAAWNAIKGTRDPSLMVDTRSWMLDIPWFASYGEQDIFTGGSTQQKKLGNKLHTVKYSIDTAGVHGGIYCKPEDLISFLDGLDWG